MWSINDVALLIFSAEIKIMSQFISAVMAGLRLFTKFLTPVSAKAPNPAAVGMARCAVRRVLYGVLFFAAAASIRADFAILAKDTTFVREAILGNSGNPVGVRVVPAGSIVDVIQEGGPSLFVEHQREFMWVGRSAIVGGRVLDASALSEKKLLQKVEFPDISNPRLPSRLTAPAGSKVQILIDGDQSCLVKFKNAVGRVPARVFSETASSYLRSNIATRVFC